MLRWKRGVTDGFGCGVEGFWGWFGNFDGWTSTAGEERGEDQDGKSQGSPPL